MMRLDPKKLTDEEKQKLDKALGNQTGVTTTPKSRDNDNYPVFEVPVNAKVFVYVPNHVVTGPDGEEELMMDKPFFHPVKEGKRFLRARCVSGLGGVIDGYPQDAECPFCNAVSECWDLAREVINEKCRGRGLDPNNTEDAQVKAIRKAAFDDRVVKNATQYVTFPIILVETDPADIKKIIRDEDGSIRYKAMWYTISMTAYEEKWLKALENLEDAPTHPGGRCFVLDYTYAMKDGESPSKMNSARNLSVHPRRSRGFEEYMKFFDEKTADWTPSKARETIYDNVIADYDSVVAACDEVMVHTRESLELRQALATGVEGAMPALGAPVGGSLTQKASAAKTAGIEDDDDDATPMVGGMETDLD